MFRLSVSGMLISTTSGQKMFGDDLGQLDHVLCFQRKFSYLPCIRGSSSGGNVIIKLKPHIILSKLFGPAYTRKLVSSQDSWSWYLGSYKILLYQANVQKLKLLQEILVE